MTAYTKIVFVSGFVEALDWEANAIDLSLAMIDAFIDYWALFDTEPRVQQHLWFVLSWIMDCDRWLSTLGASLAALLYDCAFQKEEEKKDIGLIS